MAIGDGCEVEIDCLGADMKGEVVSIAVDGCMKAQTVWGGSDVESDAYAARGAGGRARGGSAKPGR